MLRGRRSLIVLVAVATLGGAAPAASGAPVWRAIEVPEGAGGAQKPQLAFDARGDALLTWRADQPGFGFRQVRYAWRLRNGSIQPAGAISEYGATWHSAAVGWNGEAIVAWKMQDDSVHVAVSPGPGQPFGGAVVLGQPDAQSFFGEPKVVVDDLGNATVAWMRYGRGSTLPNGAMIATRTEGGSWSAPLELGPAGFGGILDVATNGAGLAAVAYRGPDNQTHVAVREPAAEGFAAPQPVDLVGPGPQVTVDPDGTITVTNRPGAALGPHAGPGDLQAVVRPPGATAFGPAGPPPDLGVAIPPDASELVVSRSTDGRTLATWTLRPEGGGPARPQPIRFAERAPGAAWTEPAAPPGDPQGTWTTSAVSRIGSIGIAWSTQIAATYTEPPQLLIREDPDAVVPVRPTRTVGGPPTVDLPAVEPSVSGQAVRGGAVRVTVTCLAECRVGGEVRIRGRRAGRLAAGRAPAGTPTTLTLRPASERVARLVRRARRDDRRVVVRVRVSTPGAAPMERRIALR